MNDPKCSVTWKMQGGLGGVGSLRIAWSWLAIQNVKKYGQHSIAESWLAIKNAEKYG